VSSALVGSPGVAALADPVELSDDEVAEEVSEEGVSADEDVLDDDVPDDEGVDDRAAEGAASDASELSAAVVVAGWGGSGVSGWVVLRRRRRQKPLPLASGWVDPAIRFASSWAG